ncbi:2TM domain-containing protein, partial [candidate division WOR-3 bacterium]|nr:2TM domain-containing protein [candidate division WOR-3 bacterium]
MKEDSKYKSARERVEEIKAFYVHLFIYIIVNVGLILVNVLTSPYSLWFYWPLMGWGIGLVAHAFSVFGIRGMFGKEWEEKKIKEILEKEKKTVKKATKTT